MARFDDLLATVDSYQQLAGENYDRIRRLAEELRQGYCDYLDASDGACVHLVPPVGQFQPRPYGDRAFSVPPRGFRPLGPVSFGLAVRVSKGTDWLRLTLECRKSGDDLTVSIMGGDEHTFSLPLSENDPEPFYRKIYDHVHDWFGTRIASYREGDSGTREIGFDFAAEADEAGV